MRNLILPEKLFIYMFDRLFNPRSVVIIGASKNPLKMGYYVAETLSTCKYKGKVYIVNPRYCGEEIHGYKVYESIQDIPDTPDLAIIVIPSKYVPSTLEECGKKGIRYGVIISAGFREADIEEGKKLFKKARDICAKHDIRVIGPNTFGLANLSNNFGACFTPILMNIKKGGITLVSQSGGVSHSIISYSIYSNIGFSKIIGLGDRLNIDFHDILYYLAEDRETRAIALYIEGVDNLEYLREGLIHTISKKPVVVYKAGRSSVADKASRLHTGSPAGEYREYSAIFREAGAIEASSIIELVSYAKSLSMINPSPIKNIAVITLVAGLGMIAMDTVEEIGFERALFKGETIDILHKLIPPYTIRDNPVDIGIVFNDLEKVSKIIEAVASDPNVDGIVINYVYSWGERLLEIPVQKIVEINRLWKKPITMALSYPPNNMKWNRYRDYLEENGIPTYPWPDLAVKSLKAVDKYHHTLMNREIAHS